MDTVVMSTMNIMVYFGIFRALLETAALILAIFCMVKYLRKPRQEPPRRDEGSPDDGIPQA